MQSVSLKRGALAERLEILIFFKLTDPLARFVAALRLHERAPKWRLPGWIMARLSPVLSQRDENTLIPPVAQENAYSA